MNKPLVFSIASVVLLVALSIAHYFVLTDGVVYTAVTFASNGHVVAGTLAVPSFLEAGDTAPGVLLFHGFTSSKEWMIPLTYMLSYVGYVVLAIDQPGHGANSGAMQDENGPDTLAAFEFISRQPQVDASTIGAAGFSMGGGSVQALSTLTDRVSSSVVIGNYIDCDAGFNATFPANVLNVLGINDELFESSVARENLACIVEDGAILPDDQGKVLAEHGKRYGSVENGDARELFLGVSDHVFGLLDPVHVDAVVRWFLETMPLPENQSRADEVSFFGFKSLNVEFLGGLVGVLWVSMFLVYLEWCAPTRGTTRQLHVSANPQIEAEQEKSVEIVDDEETPDGEVPASLSDAQFASTSRIWWIPHGAFPTIGLGAGFVLDLVFDAPICVRFGWTFLVGWGVGLTLMYLGLLSMIVGRSRALSTLKTGYKEFATCARGGPGMMFAMCVTWVLTTQLILYNVPFIYAFATPLIKSLQVVGGGGAVLKRCVLFVFLWALFTPTWLLEAEIVRLRVGRAFRMRNLGMTMLARLWFVMFVLFVLVVTIFGMQVRIFGEFSFVVLFLYPMAGVLFLLCIVTQFGRSRGHSSMSLGLFASAFVSLLMAMLLPFDNC